MVLVRMSDNPSWNYLSQHMNNLPQIDVRINIRWLNGRTLETPLGNK